MFKTTLTTLAAGALVLGSAALAGDPMKEKFMDADTNGDGMIDRAEFMAAAGAAFDKADTDGDGMLSMDEWAEMHGKMHAKHKEHGKHDRDHHEDEAD